MSSDSDTAGGDVCPGQLGLWNRVCETDPTYTKPMTGGDFAGTAISPMFLIRKATEVFGPLGLDWGYEIVEDGFHEGAPLSFNTAGECIGRAVVHILRLRLWYTHEGRKGSFEHFGQTTFVGSAGSNLRTDGDVKKKSLTDALTKCLSMLGFSADVHMGRFDDSKYVNTLVAQFSAAEAAAPPSAPSGAIAAPSAAARKARGRGADSAPAPQPAREPVSAPEATPGPDGSSVATVGSSEPPAASPIQRPVQAAVAVPLDIDRWIKRIGVTGRDGIATMRSTARELFKGEDLARIEAALDQRAQKLNAATRAA